MMVRSSRCCSASPLVAGSRPQVGQAMAARAAAWPAAVLVQMRSQPTGRSASSWESSRCERVEIRAYPYRAIRGSVPQTILARFQRHAVSARGCDPLRDGAELGGRDAAPITRERDLNDRYLPTRITVGW